MIALRDIEPNEQLLFSYLPINFAFEHPVLKFEHLKRIYFFDCGCIDCMGLIELSNEIKMIKQSRNSE